MNNTATEQIRIMLVKNNNMSEAELARQLDTTPQNLNAKLRRNNFSESEIRRIANILGFSVELKYTKKK